MAGINFFLTAILLMFLGWALYFRLQDKKEERRQREENAHHSE